MFQELGKGPKIKKRKSMVFDHTPWPPPNLNYGLFTQNFFVKFVFDVNMIENFQNVF